MIWKILGGLMIFPGMLAMFALASFLDLHPMSPWIVIPWGAIALSLLESE